MTRRAGWARYALLFPVLVVSACNRGPDASVQTAKEALISDELHSGGTAGFLFLPPMVPKPAYYGEFLPNVPVTVRVDEIRPDGSTLRSLATFTKTTGPGREHIRIHYQDAPADPDDTDGDTDPSGYFLARWATDDAHLSTVALYRVRALVPAAGGGTRELGFADLNVVTNEKQFRSVDTQSFTPLVNGKTLRIKFRVDRPAVDRDGDGVFDWADNCPAVGNPDQKDTLGNGVGDACHCLGVTCTAADGCHLKGVCQPTNGACTNPAAPEGAACPLSNAPGVCRAGLCQPAACAPGWADCDGNPANGCERDLATTTDCGACGRACADAAHGAAACVAGACALRCAPGFADCNGSRGDGCEQNVASDSGNCGGCGAVCPNHSTCQAGACSNAACQPGFADCDGQAADGCETGIGNDPSNCGRCGAVCAFAHAGATCTGGACAMTTCQPGFADCDGDATSGCETSLLADSAHCGACGTACAPAHGSGLCVNGTCGLAACAAGFADCNGDVIDGCEKNLDADPSSCGACGNSCVVPNAAPACSAGSCVVGACHPGYADCDQAPGNGCERNLDGDPTSCGACGHICATGPNATATCTFGACGIVCAAGFADCDGLAANGCEINVAGDPGNCGACGTTCGNHETCQAGGCSTSVCGAGYADCNRDATDGCEVALAGDAANCGACGTVCTFAHAYGACTGGACGFAVCEPGFADCDGIAANGCEVDVGTDAGNCGGCGQVCAFGNASASCVAGVCGIASCVAGFADCDSAVSDGCETNVSLDPADCGACGTVCDPANAAGTCAAGACAIATCNPGFADCDGNVVDGCEQDIAFDLANCGGCGQRCALPNAAPACAAGACAIAACNPGFADCDGDPRNGCEQPILDDAANCGACNLHCAVNHDTAACHGGACGVAACDPGFADCNGRADDGCETNSGSDVNNCGGCGHACAAENGASVCVAGSCGIGSCSPGWSDCNGNPADGCEVHTAADPNNCGICGAACHLPGGAAACSGGACTLAACDPGFADCNHAGEDGCEVSLGGDVFNCGACGNVCPASQGTPACSAGACSLAACDPGFADCNHSNVDGCEDNVLSDAANCGSCGAACALPNAASACTSGSCRVAACNAGFADCDGVAANGCETNLATSASSCGACGHACSGGSTCNGGVCALACLSQPNDPVTGQKCPISTPCTAYADCGTQTGCTYWYCSTNHTCQFLPQTNCFTAAAGTCSPGPLTVRQDSSAPYDKRIVPPDGVNFREGTSLAFEVRNASVGDVFLDQVPLTLELGGTSPSQFDVTGVKMYQIGSISDFGDGNNGTQLVCSSPSTPFASGLNFTLGTGSTGCGGSSFSRIPSGGSARFIIDLTFAASETFIANRQYRLKIASLSSLKVRSTTISTPVSLSACTVPTGGFAGSLITFKAP